MMKPPFMRNPYNYDRDAASDESGLACPEPTLAQQQFKDETDINTIMERFGMTGQLTVSARMPQYADFESVMDYHSAMNAVVSAQQSFDSLPAKVRARFNNDAGAFVEFCLDEKNRDEAIALGLAEAVSKPASPAIEPSSDGSAQ